MLKYKDLMLRPFRYTMWRNVIVLLCLLCTVLPSCAAGQCDVEYVLDITEEVISPACSPRLSLVVNGTLPGPFYPLMLDNMFT